MNYSLVGSEDGSNITVFVKGKTPLVAHSSHPNFDKIVELARAGDESVINLFDAAQTAADKFDKLTERVSVANGRMYLDGEEVNNALTVQVVGFLSEGVEDWKPLVNFFENVLANPNEHSREQLYSWLDAEHFTITPDGMIVGYKSVDKQNDGTFLSIHAGHAVVDGKVQNGRIRQSIGAVVEMPRGIVHHDPTQGCSVGLHVGTWSYASTFSGNTVLEVHVNPRDVVSVPTDCDSQKMRTCRYRIAGVLDKPYQESLAADYKEFEGTLADGLDDEPVEEPVEDLEDSDAAEPALDDSSVSVGDVYEDTDKRRAGRTFKVESLEGDYAVGKSLPQGVTRKIRTDRLLSRKYRRAS